MTAAVVPRGKRAPTPARAARRAARVAGRCARARRQRGRGFGGARAVSGLPGECIEKMHLLQTVSVLLLVLQIYVTIKIRKCIILYKLIYIIFC